jgi:hypothetical protein
VDRPRQQLSVLSVNSADSLTSPRSAKYMPQTSVTRRMICPNVRVSRISVVTGYTSAATHATSGRPAASEPSTTAARSASTPTSCAR